MLQAVFDSRQHLEHARRQATGCNYAGLLIVDADAHHNETDSMADIVKYIEDPVLRYRAEGRHQVSGHMHPDPQIEVALVLQHGPPDQHADERAARALSSAALDLD